MTREEKSKAIDDFCKGFFNANEEGCFGCPLGKNVGECTNLNDAESYDILVKAGLIVPDDEIETADDKVDEAHERFMNIGEKTVNYPQMAHVPGNATSEFTAIHNTVNHPFHYTKGGIECIDAIRASMTSDGFCDYCKGNVIKYIWRWRDKGGVQDLEKAKVYLDWLIEEAKGCQNGQ